MNVIIDKKLQNDTRVVAQTDVSILLLHNNALFPWFILVPKTNQKEFYRLDESLQIQLLKQIRSISLFIEQIFQVEKMNIATIGNVVSQLHIHIVGRNRSDVCWPNVVWGCDTFKMYQQVELDKIIFALKESLSNQFEVINE